MGKALLFPGQAAQFVGMGTTMSSESPKAKEMLVRANEILGYDLVSIMAEGPEEKLKETVYTQPAVFLHSAIIYELHKEEADFGAVAGHSLGEITACVAARVMSFEDGLRLVQKRAEAMQMACEKNPSTMAAILGMSDEAVETICDGIEEVVVAANYNCPGQLVISGSNEGIAKAVDAAKEGGAKRALVIPVGGAFHSPLMEPAVDVFKEAILQMEFSDAVVPVYQNVHASPEKDGDIIKSNLIAQITSPVRWTQSIQNMMSDGFSEFVEVGGKGKILMGMLRKISRDANTSLWSES